MTDQRDHGFTLIEREPVMYECHYCGAAVNDIDVHRQWHRELEGQSS